jgi:hypothetical protein
VLVEAGNEDQARERGQAALEELYAELRRQFDAEMAVNILAVRPATPEEIEFSRWNEGDARPRTDGAPRLARLATTSSTNAPSWGLAPWLDVPFGARGARMRRSGGPQLFKRYVAAVIRVR